MLDNKQEIPIEFCPYCGKNLIKTLSKQEQQKYKLPYLNEKIGISNWDSIYAWKCPFCEREWPR